MSNADLMDAQRHYRIMATLRGRMYELDDAAPDELAWVDRAVADAGDRLAQLGLSKPRHLHVVQDEEHRDDRCGD